MSSSRQAGASPAPASACALKPTPLVPADDYYGEPGQSPLRYGADMVRFKPRCDVLFDAVARIPDARMTRTLKVSASIGNWSKTTRAEGQPMQSSDALNAPIIAPRLEAFGAVAGHQKPRKKYAGTYDEAWRRNQAPFLPEDFDERFNQCAPEDQQIDPPRGGEEMCLTHMFPETRQVRFHLPNLMMKVRVPRKDTTTETLDAPADTLYFETESRRFSVVWRASTPMRRRIHEFATIAVGAVDPRWWRDRSLGLDGGGCFGCGGEEAA